MKTIWKVIIVCVVVGLILAVLGLSLGASREVSFGKSGPHVVDNAEAQKIAELDLDKIENIDVQASYADIEFVESDQYGIEIVYYEQEPSWHLDDGTLTVSFNEDNTVHLFNFSLQDKTSSVKIYLPRQADLGAVSLQTDSGYIDIGSFKALDTRIYNDYGDVSLTDVTSDSLYLELNSGQAVAANVTAQEIAYSNDYGEGVFTTIATKSLTVNHDSGDFTLNGCQTDKIEIKSAYGKISAADLVVATGTNIDADSGDIDVSGNFAGETVIYADYGDIMFATAKEKGDYSWAIATDYGNITFDGEKMGDNARVESGNVSKNHLKVNADSGNIEILFAK